MAVGAVWAHTLASKLADKARKGLLDGVDPIAEKQQKREQAPTTRPWYPAHRRRFSCRQSHSRPTTSWTGSPPFAVASGSHSTGSLFMEPVVAR
jgi:hypothetical protein